MLVYLLIDGDGFRTNHAIDGQCTTGPHFARCTPKHREHSQRTCLIRDTPTKGDHLSLSPFNNESPLHADPAVSHGDEHCAKFQVRPTAGLNTFQEPIGK